MYFEEVNVIIIDLPISIKAMLSKNNDDSYTIFINAKHSYTTQRNAYIHELKHIYHNDMYSDKDIDEIELKRHLG